MGSRGVSTLALYAGSFLHSQMDPSLENYTYGAQNNQNRV